MKEIVLDTETTGISVKEGHRIVEIGCIELENLIPTKKKFHCYLNPERKVSEKAFEVHGYSDSFLSNKMKFAEIADDFLQFIKDKSTKYFEDNVSAGLNCIPFSNKLKKIRYKNVNRNKLKNILVFISGSDPSNISYKIVKGLKHKNFENLKIQKLEIVRKMVGLRLQKAPGGFPRAKSEKDLLEMEPCR